MASIKCSYSALSSEESRWAYQMALDSASNRNFITRNPKEAIRLIENLASSNITKNTDFERNKSAPALGKEQLEDVKAKLDSVHKLLKK